MNVDTAGLAARATMEREAACTQAEACATMKEVLSYLPPRRNVGARPVKVEKLFDPATLSQLEQPCT